MAGCILLAGEQGMSMVIEYIHNFGYRSIFTTKPVHKLRGKHGQDTVPKMQVEKSVPAGNRKTPMRGVSL